MIAFLLTIVLFFLLTTGAPPMFAPIEALGIIIIILAIAAIATVVRILFFKWLF